MWLRSPVQPQPHCGYSLAAQTRSPGKILLATLSNPPMKIWVDADACPGAVKQILFRAARRTGIPLTLVANQPIRVPRTPTISTVQVASGFDVADNEIVSRLDVGDLVITADIPLAAEAIDKQALALSPRGELFTRDNIKARLGMRDFLENLRGAGVDTGGPPPFNQNDRHAFAQQLDRLLAKYVSQS